MPQFISRCLENRTFSMRIGSTLSDLYDQEEGVHQGSILCHIANSIVKVIKDGID